MIYLTIGCLILAVYLLFDPLQTAWMPKCPVKVLTGLDCPGCGSQRALHALLTGDVAAAFRFNALLLLLLPYVAVIAVLEFSGRRHLRLYRVLGSQAAIAIVLVLVVAWTVVRNLFSL